MKLVSVVIPVYNVEKYIHATVKSVLEQTYKNFELFIIDDGSADRSIEICKQFKNPKIKIIHQKNQGVAAARNTGIRHASGDYIAFLDADDIWLSDKLEKHVEHLENCPNVGVSFSRSAFIDETGEPLGIYQMSKLKDITPLDLLCRTPIGNGSVPVIRQEVFDSIEFQQSLQDKVQESYFDNDSKLHPSEDVECWLRIALQTDWEIEGIAEPLTLYRVNSQGFSAQLFKKLNSWRILLQKARSYTSPELIAKWEKPAMAYQFRYLARRAVTLDASLTAVNLAHRSLLTYWQILLEEPRRTLMTLTASYLSLFLPKILFDRIQFLAMKIAGLKQRNNIVKDRIGQIFSS
jgi:glycosyltransferase involved in cell wall biosynthesis